MGFQVKLMKWPMISWFTLLHLAAAGLAQKYHSPEEIFKRIDTSPMQYRIKLLADTDTLPDESHPVLEHGLVLWQERGGEPMLTTIHAVLQKDRYLAGYISAAENALRQGRPAAARRAYLALLAAAPDDAQDMTLIGQTFAMEGDSAKAMACYRKAIRSNYYDFVAHELLAGWLWHRHQPDSAITEMTIAHILNRNNPAVMAEYHHLLQRAGRRYDAWEFRPIYKLEETADAKIIKYDLSASEWLGYALCKALWRFEPGYADSVLQEVKAPAEYIQEIEAVQALLYSRKAKDDIGPDRALQTLLRAAEKEMIQEYVLYEIMLRKDPAFVFYLPETQVAAMAHYIQRFRIFNLF
jgi:tetratricopeptide (TPR) repeat protein